MHCPIRESDFSSQQKNHTKRGLSSEDSRSIQKCWNKNTDALVSYTILNAIEQWRNGRWRQAQQTSSWSIMIGILPLVCLQLLEKQSMTQSSIKWMIGLVDRRFHLPEDNERDCVYTHGHSSIEPLVKFNGELLAVIFQRINLWDIVGSVAWPSRSDDSQMALHSSIYSLSLGWFIVGFRGIALETNDHCSKISQRWIG